MVYLMYRVHKETCIITEILCLLVVIIVMEIIGLFGIKGNIDIYSIEMTSV